MEALRPRTSPPWVIAHRGASATCPENTTAAFDEALVQDCDGIELDVQLSRDGVPMVYHDRTLHKAGGGRKRISQLEAEEIAKLDMGAWLDPRYRGQRIPSLRDVLRRYGRRTRLLVELKVRERDRSAGSHARLAESVASLIRSMRLERRVAVLSFDAEALEIATGASPGLRAVLNLKAPRRMSRALRSALGRLWALSVDLRTLSPSIVRSTHQLGKPVLTFTCNTERSVRRAIACGADAIMTDRPGWLREALRRFETRR